MTFLWFSVWGVVSLFMGHSAKVDIEAMNGWAATLVLCLALDLLVAAWSKNETKT